MNRNGLVNLGNTCYLNTIIQCLRHCTIFTQYICSNVQNKDSICTAFRHSIDQLNKGATPVSPKELVVSIMKKARTKKNSEFVDFRQNDAHEFLIFIMDCFHEAFKKKVNIRINGAVKNTYDKQIKEGMESFSKFYKNEYSSLIPLFFGQYQTVVHYTDKNEISYSYQPFLCVQLDIPRMRGANIYDCLELMQRADKINATTYKSCFLWNTPMYLIFSLKRFIMGRKNGIPVDIPFTLNVRQYVTGPHKYTQTNYELIAVCNHAGNVGGGHYYAFCRDDKKKWRCYNDTSVVDIDPKNVSTPNAYCIFYKKLT